MPTSDELANLTYDSYSTSNSSTAVPSGDDNAAGKYVFADASYGAFTTTNPDGSYVLPASGYRGSSDGALSNVGYRGRYWSGSAYDGNDVYYLLFDSNSSAGASLNFRSSGRSVRCVLQE
jgi:hypothetical protein